LYGALLSACQSGVGRRILMENRDKQDGIRSWCHLAHQYDTDGNRNVRIKRLENVINTVFHCNYRGGLVKWIQDYEGDAFTELALLGQKTWNDDDIKKRRFVQNAQNIGLVDTVFEELVSNKSFIETCNFLDHMPSDLISNIRKKLQDKSTILANYPIKPRRIKSKRSQN
jgi:hypothetical protein